MRQTEERDASMEITILVESTDPLIGRVVAPTRDVGPVMDRRQSWAGRASCDAMTDDRLHLGRLGPAARPGRLSCRRHEARRGAWSERPPGSTVDVAAYA